MDKKYYKFKIHEMYSKKDQEILFKCHVCEDIYLNEKKYKYNYDNEEICNSCSYDLFEKCEVCRKEQTKKSMKKISKSYSCDYYCEECHSKTFKKCLFCDGSVLLSDSFESCTDCKYKYYCHRCMIKKDDITEKVGDTRYCMPCYKIRYKKCDMHDCNKRIDCIGENNCRSCRGIHYKYCEDCYEYKLKTNFFSENICYDCVKKCGNNICTRMFSKTRRNTYCNCCTPYIFKCETCYDYIFTESDAIKKYKLCKKCVKKRSCLCFLDKCIVYKNKNEKYYVINKRGKGG